MPKTRNIQPKKEKTTKESTKNVNLANRKKTRRIEKGLKLPLFLINGEEFVSCYDIRSFLEDQPGNKLKYEFRKKFQTMERNNPEKRLMIENKDISKSFKEENKNHINPNKATPFLKLSEIENPKGTYHYLKKQFNIPLDYQKIIDFNGTNNGPKNQVESCMMEQSESISNRNHMDSNSDIASLMRDECEDFFFNAQNLPSSISFPNPNNLSHFINNPPNIFETDIELNTSFFKDFTF